MAVRVTKTVTLQVGYSSTGWAPGQPAIETDYFVDFDVVRPEDKPHHRSAFWVNQDCEVCGIDIPESMTYTVDPSDIVLCIPCAKAEVERTIWER